MKRVDVLGIQGFSSGHQSLQKGKELNEKQSPAGQKGLS